MIFAFEFANLQTVRSLSYTASSSGAWQTSAMLQSEERSANRTSPVVEDVVMPPIQIAEHTADDLRRLRLIAELSIGDEYWEDETIKRYRMLGLVSRKDGRIQLTEAGERSVSQMTDLLTANIRWSSNT